MNEFEVNEVLKWVWKVNGMGARQQDETGNLPTVFAYFSGHVAGLTIRVYENGWDSEEAVVADRTFEFKTDKPLLWKDYCEYDDYMEELYERTF